MRLEAMIFVSLFDANRAVGASCARAYAARLGVGGALACAWLALASIVRAAGASLGIGGALACAWLALTTITLAAGARLGLDGALACARLALTTIARAAAARLGLDGALACARLVLTTISLAAGASLSFSGTHTCALLKLASIVRAAGAHSSIGGTLACARPAPALAARPGIGIALVCAWLTIAPAHAASMLRCEGDDHSVSYVSTRPDDAHCSRVSMSWQPQSQIQPQSPVAVSDPKPKETRRAILPAAIGPIDGENAALPLAASRRASFSRREATTRIYSYVEDGVRHYLTNKPEGAALDVTVMPLQFIETCALCASDTPVNVATLLLDTRAFQREIDASASAFGVDGALVRAVIHAESAYRANAISRAGAQGLMQLMPSTALRFGVGDPFDAAQNIRGGVQYLAWLLRRFGNDLDRALAAYNSGEAAVDRYNGVPPYAETTVYVARVKALADRYRRGR